MLEQDFQESRMRQPKLNLNSSMELTDFTIQLKMDRDLTDLETKEEMNKLH